MRRIGIVDWYGGYNGEKRELNKFGYLQGSIRINEKNIISNTELFSRGSVVTYELVCLNNKEYIGKEVRLLEDEDSLEVLLAEVNNDNKEIANFVKDALANLLGKSSYNELAEAVFEGVINNEKVKDYFSNQWIVEINRLDGLEEDDFKSYTPGLDFQSQIYYIYKSLWIAWKTEDETFLITSKEKILCVGAVNKMVECLVDIIRFALEDIHKNTIIEIIVKNLWEFLIAKQHYIKTRPNVIFRYLEIMLPKCCSAERFRDARVKRVMETVMNDDSVEIVTLNGKKENCTGEFWCEGAPNGICHHAEMPSMVSKDKKFQVYTLLDMFSVLVLESTLPEVYYDECYYIALICGWINHMIEPKKSCHFFCSKCGKLMVPSIYGNIPGYKMNWVRTTTVFNCEESKYGHDRDVYISHCRNPECVEIIDSRMSEWKCERNKIVCYKCGFCNCEGVHIEKECLDEKCKEYRWLNIRDMKTDIENAGFINGFNPEQKV